MITVESSVRTIPHDTVCPTRDDAGRLTRATASDGTARLYAYNARDEMIVVREPGRVVENGFDESGRLIKQIVHLSGYDEPYVMTFSYVVDGGSVMQTDVGEDDGTRTIYRFNKRHYTVSETRDADGRAPITVVYNRDESTNVANTMTLSCLGPTGLVTRTVPLPAKFDDQVTEDLIREQCSAHRR
jgi:YD repeat-containing protein